MGESSSLLGRASLTLFNSTSPGLGVSWRLDNRIEYRRHMPRLFKVNDAIAKVRGLIRDESNAFVVEAGLIVALILTVILVRVIQYAGGS